MTLSPRIDAIRTEVTGENNEEGNRASDFLAPLSGVHI